MPRLNLNSDGAHVVALKKEDAGETYVFLNYDDDDGPILRQMGMMATDPELSFTWYDAAICSQRFRKLRAQ